MDTRPIVVALPGFTRGPQHLQRLADACQAAGWRCERPVLAPRWLPVLYMVPSRLRGIARRIAREAGERPIVVAGHSAGGAAGAAIAADLIGEQANIRGLVLIDGVESPNHLIARNLPALDRVRVAAVLAPPSPCNRQGQLERALGEHPWVRHEVVPGAGHGDIEGAGIGVYRRACSDSSDAATAAHFLDRVMAAITWAFGGDDDHAHH